MWARVCACVGVAVGEGVGVACVGVWVSGGRACVGVCAGVGVWVCGRVFF